MGDSLRKDNSLDLETLMKTMKSNYWLNNVSLLVTLAGQVSPDKNDFKLIFSNLLEYSKAKKIGRTLNWLALGLVLNQEKTVKYIMHNGVFRVANYNYNGTFLYNVHRKISEVCNEINLNKKNKNYFFSKSLFLSALSKINEIYHEIKRDIRCYQKTLLKDLLAISDFYFFKNIERKQITDPSKLDFYTKEEIAESISFILFQLLNTTNLELNCINESNVDNILKNKYEKLIINSCLLKKYVEWEILIDSFNYQCVIENKEINLKANDDFLEKSIQHGRIYSYIQQMNFHLKALSAYRSEAASLEEFCEMIYKKMGHEILKRIQEPIERLVLHLPEYPPIFDFLKNNAFCLEEIIILAGECRDMLTELNELLQFKVCDNLTFKDIIVVDRLFNFLRIIFSKYLDKHLKDEPEIVFRSIVPVFQKDYLITLIATVVEKETAETYLDLFTWDENKKQLFDLQYRPIIRIDDHYILPINIVCKSNIFRNTLYILRKRLFDQKEFDPIANLLQRNIRDKGYNVKTNIKFNKNGIEGDIDLAAQVGNTTLIVEAKNTLHPGNIFEMRTTYDNLIKAETQLTKIKQALIKSVKEK